MFDINKTIWGIVALIALILMLLVTVNALAYFNLNEDVIIKKVSMTVVKGVDLNADESDIWFYHYLEDQQVYKVRISHDDKIKYGIYKVGSVVEIPEDWLKRAEVQSYDSMK
jgi:hypothetical protein